MSELQASMVFQRDELQSSVRNHLIDLYENLNLQSPEKYKGNLYPQILAPSNTRSNYGAAAEYTADTPVNNTVRWGLQQTAIAYGLSFGEGELSARAASSTDFNFQLHQVVFQGANNVDTIGRLPWAMLTWVDVPATAEMLTLPLHTALGAVQGTIVGTEAALQAGFEALATTTSPEASNAAAARAFSVAYSQAMESQRVQASQWGGWFINQTIEEVNPPSGQFSSHGRVMRGYIDLYSWVLTPFFD
jgi:hypothetical protein